VPLTNILEQLETGHDPDRHVRGTYNCNCSEKNRVTEKNTTRHTALFRAVCVLAFYVYIFRTA
jgi:hypothetical protein